jgi:hypothetical protein
MKLFSCSDVSIAVENYALKCTLRGYYNGFAFSPLCGLFSGHVKLNGKRRRKKPELSPRWARFLNHANSYCNLGVNLLPCYASFCITSLAFY